MGDGRPLGARARLGGATVLLVACGGGADPGGTGAGRDAAAGGVPAVDAALDARGLASDASFAEGGGAPGADGALPDADAGVPTLDAALPTCTIFVVAGASGGTGTQTSPFGRIQAGIDAAKPGDTICVDDGTYHEGLTFAQSGAPGAPITLRAGPGAHPVVDAGGDAEGVLVNASGATEGDGKPIGWLVIEGLTVTDSHDGMLWYNAHDIVLRGSVLSGNVWQGLLVVGSTRVTLDGNVFSDNGYTGQPDATKHGVYGMGTTWTVTNNLFYGNSAYGLQVAGYPYCPNPPDPTYPCTGSEHYPPGTIAGPEYAGASGWTVSNNVFALQHYHAGIVLWLPGTEDVLVQNNVFFDNATDAPSDAYGVFFSSPSGGNVLLDNVFYCDSGNPKLDDDTGGTSYTESGSIAQDPAFVSAATFDFHLTAASPAIDTGAAASAPDHDFDDVRRPIGKGFDIGAFEFH